MDYNRRRFIGSAIFGTSILSSPYISILYASSSTPLPDPKSLQSGDFIWPKKPGAYVPYRSGVTNSAREESVVWAKQRDYFFDSVVSSKNETTIRRLSELKNMTFREFYARYAGDQVPDVRGVYSFGDGLYVGHVAILEVDENGEPWVIEALSKLGVVRQRYIEWLKLRPGINVWHGRVQEISSDDQKRLVKELSKHIGRPYDFWNFDLNDDKSFYCSKLVWLSVFRSLGIAIDGNNDPQRSFWFSPKQLLYTDKVSRLHNPGPYAYS